MEMNATIFSLHAAFTGNAKLERLMEGERQDWMQ
jgi:hypothetical protein